MERKKSWRLWPDVGEGPWELHFEWDVVRGRAECVGFCVRWTDREPLAAPLDERDDAPPWTHGPAHVTTSLLRSVPFASLLKDERAACRRFLSLMIEDGWVPDESLGDAEDELAAFSAKGGRPALYTPEHYRRVADVYLKAWRAGEPPTKAVQEDPEFLVPRSTAAKWVAKARVLGFLPPATATPGSTKREASGDGER